MAVKISGTTVVDDSRALTNIVGLDATTISTIENNITTSAVGGGTDEIFWENDQTITTDYTITSNKNAVSAGSITVADGVTVTIPSGSRWAIV